MNISVSAFVPDNLVSRDGFGSPVPRQSPNLHTQAIGIKWACLEYRFKDERKLYRMNLPSIRLEGWFPNVVFKENQNAPRPSEHPPVMGEKCQNWDQRLQIQNLVLSQID